MERTSRPARLGMLVACALVSTACSGSTDGAQPRAPRGGGRPTTTAANAPDASDTTLPGGDRPGTTRSPTTTTAVPSTTTSARRGFRCRAGRNGGATDRGVTATKVRLGATAVLNGPKSGLHTDALPAVKAVVGGVNRSGGICGRLLDVQVVNRPSSSAVAELADAVFAALGIPMVRGLAEAVRNGTLDRARTPFVVATDPIHHERVASPWLWELGPSSAALGRVAVDHAYRAVAARSFAVVYDARFRFGVEAVEAVHSYVGRLPGATVRTTQGLDPDRPGYGPEIAAFNHACGDRRCDVVLLALLPETAVKWWKGRPAAPAKQLAALPLLLSDRFADDCTFLDPRCGVDDLLVWTGSTPPIGSFLENPDVDAYVREVGGASASADVRNPSVEAAYVAATVLVEALRRVGPNLTREQIGRAHV